MRSKQTFFFTSLNDMVSVMERFEELHDVRYSLTGMLATPDIEYFNSYKDLPHIGSVKYDDWMHNENYLVMPNNVEVQSRAVEQRSGGVRYGVDQMINEQSIVFRPSGNYNDQLVIGGSCGTISSHITSVRLYTDLSKLIKRSYERIGNFYVGKNADEYLKKGARLVTNAQSPKGYDLTRS